MDPLVPQMHAEAGFEADEESVPPLRISGFLCLLFGILSFLSCIGRPLLVLPVLAFLCGLVALRKYSGPTPLGVRAARIGLVLAVGFGVCGLTLPWFKTRTLARQAEHFGRYYLDVVAMGEDEFAMELNKDDVNRFPTTMSLEEHYQGSPQARERLEEFQSNSVNELLRKRGPGAEWVLDQPVRIYYSYRREHAELVWADPTGSSDSKILMILDYRIDSNGDGQWYVATVQSYLRQRIVAPSVL